MQGLSFVSRHEAYIACEQVTPKQKTVHYVRAEQQPVAQAILKAQRALLIWQKAPGAIYCAESKHFTARQLPGIKGR